MITQERLTHLKQLEAESIHILREVAAEFSNPVMMYSVGKDSSVMLHLAIKAFAPSKPPFPMLHVDTKWKFKEMIAFRDQRAIDLDFDLSHPCIEYVVSSLSKVFPIENHRVGIRLQKEPFEDQIYVINEYNYNYINLLSAFLGTAMMKKFPADYVFEKYHDKQLALCQKLDLVPSYFVYFGIDYSGRFREYNRGSNGNRLCFSRIWDGRMTYDL